MFHCLTPPTLHFRPLRRAFSSPAKNRFSDECEKWQKARIKRELFTYSARWGLGDGWENYVVVGVLIPGPEKKTTKLPPLKTGKCCTCWRKTEIIIKAENLSSFESFCYYLSVGNKPSASGFGGRRFRRFCCLL